MIYFKLEKRPNAVGIPVDTVIKVEDSLEEEWSSVEDLDRLFSTCNARWGNNWNLDKLILAIQECEFD